MPSADASSVAAEQPGPAAKERWYGCIAEDADADRRAGGAGRASRARRRAADLPAQRGSRRGRELARRSFDRSAAHAEISSASARSLLWRDEREQPPAAASPRA